MRGLLKILFLLIVLTPAANAQIKTADCAKVPAQPVMQVALPGRPFSAIPSRDGCSIFVSITGRSSHLLVLSRGDGAVTVAHDVTAQGALTGMRLSPDGKVLAAANQVGVTLFDTAKLIAGDANPVIGYLNDSPNAGSIYTIFSADQRLLFVADENTRGLTVHDLGALAAGKDRVIGRVPTGNAPVGLALSPDGKWFYSTSEADVSGDRVCAPEGGGGGPLHPQGRLMVIDVARAAADPANAVVADVAAGCNPVRVVLSADGARAYVTARGDDAVRIFDTARLKSGNAQIGKVAVITSPVGIAVAGGKIFVTNSGRFGNQDQSLSVLDQSDPTKPALTIPAGKFPRELAVTPDGNTLLLTNFGSGSLELVDLTRLGAGK